MTDIPQEQSRSGFASGRERQSVLIVEDQKLVAWDIEQTLRENGFAEFMFATSLRSTRELLQSSAEGILVAILDLKLEDGDASILIDDFIANDIPVVVMTGYSGFSHAQVPVLYKPFSNGALMETIKSLLGSNS
jgi:DNA-binding NtrC family response regulator